MDLKFGCLLCLLLVSEVTSQSLNEATILTPPGQTVYSSVDSIVLLSCQVDNLQSGAKINWVFAKHSLTIFHGDSLQVDDTRYSLKHPPHSNVYDLQIYPARASDQGSYKCEIDGTKKAVTVQLVLRGAPALPQVNTKPLNHTGCCVGLNVSRSCFPACAPSSLDSSFNPSTSCNAADVLKLVQCGSDGRNHENCCARRKIPALCLPLCSNDQERIASLGDAEIVCLNHTTDIISCYEFGAVTLPGAPREVSVLPRASGPGQYGLLVSWKPPFTNPVYVSGYVISYKKTFDPKYRTSAMQSSTTTQYIINDLLVNMEYSVYVTAVGDHGSSQPSYQIDTVLEDTSQPGLATNMLSCCMNRRVSPECQTLLCHATVWATFNTTNMLQCYQFLPDVFTCLAGGSDHTTCCTANNIPELCLGMCGGQPPAFDNSLAQCIPKLSTIEACVQVGLATLPVPPVQLTLQSVSAHEALVSWNPSNHTGSTAIKAYYVQLRRGNENARWVTVDVVVGTYVQLTNLTETENYALRVVAQNEEDSSLPSETVRFTTYAETTSDTDRPVVPHNMTQCCADSGMPDVCAQGCRYLRNITGYFEQHLLTCFSHIGQVLACGSDGRDHSPCCEREGILPQCLPLCAHVTPGPLDPVFYQCIENTATAVACFKEGLEDRVRMPDNVTVTNVTTQHIQIEWFAPRTGPRPEKYIVFYKNVNSGMNKTEEMEMKVYVLQNLMPGMQYEIKVASFLNNSRSPFTGTITAFTPITLTPIVPGGKTNTTSAGLWTSRQHCCESSNISDACQPVCLNQPAINGVDCSSEEHKILVCAADGKDHSQCCQENGLATECLPLCSSSTTGDFNVRTAGCQANANLDIITSCFLSNADVVPSAPQSFYVDNLGDSLKLWWKEPALNCALSETCFYDVHYWPSENKTQYRTIFNVTSPYTMQGLLPDRRFTFTVTARNSKGSSSAAPWRTEAIITAVPDVSIAQDPERDIHEVGSYVRLVCDAFNFLEAPMLTWMTNNRVLGNGGALILRQITKDMEGNFTCIASTRTVMVSVNSYLNIRFQPQLTYFRTDSVAPSIGGQAVLACWFRGHPFTNTTQSAWMKDGQPFSVASSKYSSTATTRLHTGITAFRLKIANIVPSDYGIYKCTASNHHGAANGSTRLLDPDSMPPEVSPAPPQRQNITGCCSRHSVPEACMRMCRFEVDINEAVSNPEEYGVCLFFFNELVMCATDGADHTECCRSNGVDPFCWAFCTGQTPASQNVFSDPRLLQCVPQVTTMFGCLARGYDRIPTAPLNIRANLASDTISVRWDLPARNAHRVAYYRIYYNSTGNPVPQTHLVTVLSLYYVIEDILPNHIYYVWMRSGNEFGESQPSDKVTVSVHGILPMPPTELKVTVFDGTGVQVAWIPPPSESARVDGYAVFYKPTNSVKDYIQVRTRSTSIRILNLQPQTEYVLFVKSVNFKGLGNVASDAVHFMTAVYTGTTGLPGAYESSHHGEESISGAQIAGIVLAIVAVAAIGAVIFLLISRGRIQQQKRTESVAFENPGYGNQQVRIGGLPVDSPYDNVMQPPSIQESEGSFGYSRLNEDQMAAAAESMKSVPEMEHPSPQVEQDNPAKLNLDLNGSKQNVATIAVSDITVQEKNESTT